ncbi:MAG: DUF5318 family protein [Acidimicrobiia bacterium]
MPSQVDYRLARRAVLRSFRSGRLSRGEVCDAHPELLRAARNVGEECEVDCPICSQAKLRLVSYVFSEALKTGNGRCVVGSSELARLMREVDEFVCYIVEVCPDCSWNHLARSEVLGRLHPKPGPGQGGRLVAKSAVGLGGAARRGRVPERPATPGV